MYREHDNSHLMHSFERQFFRFVMKQIDYKSFTFIDAYSNTCAVVTTTKSIDELIDAFCKGKHKDPDIKAKQLKFYLRKWEFVTSTSTIFKNDDSNKLTIILDIIPSRYLSIVPERVVGHLISNTFGNGRNYLVSKFRFYRLERIQK